MEKTWQEKLQDKPSLPRVLEPEIRFSCYNAIHIMGAQVADKTAYDEQLVGSGQVGTGVLKISLE